MIKNFIFICLTFFDFCCRAQSFTVTYGFADVTTVSGTIDPSASPTVSGLTFDAFSASGTSPNPSASGRFSFTDWPLGGINGTDDYSTFTGALSPTVYYEVSISVDPGFTLSLNSFTFAVRRSGTGIRNYCVRSSLDHYINNLAVSSGTNPDLSVLPGDVFFWNFDSGSTSTDEKGSQVNPGAGFSALTNMVNFRIYAWNAESSGGSFSIDNVTFVGSVAAPDLLGWKMPVQEKEISLYPNPNSDGRVTLQHNGEEQIWNVFSATGALLLSKSSEACMAGSVLDLSGLENGVYFLRSSSAAGNIVTRLILSKP